MKFYKLGLLTMLISLFILSSCENPEGVGLEIDPNEQIQGTLIDTITVRSTTLPEDSIVTTNLVKVPLAYMKDPIFGITEANIVTSLGLPNATKFTVPTGSIVIDSAVLVLKYAPGFYGDSLNTQFRVNVHQLLEKPELKSYYNTKEWPYNPIVIGGRTFKARPTQPLKINSIITGAPDSIINIPAQLRIPVDNQFVQTNIFGASTSRLASNEAFNNYIKGLYITLDKERTIGENGGSLFFTADSSRLDVYYRVTSAGKTDTTVSMFTVNKVTAAQVKHNYTGTPVAETLTSSVVSENISYLQGLLGLRVKISFPYLEKFKQAAGNISLNRAELVITPTFPVENIFKPNARFTLYRYDIAKQRKTIPDATTTDPRFIGLDSFGGFYDGTKKAYRFVITGFIQDLLRGRLQDYGTFISPADPYNFTSVDISPSIQTSGRTVFGGGANDAGLKLKLNIIYTKLN